MTIRAIYFDLGGVLARTEFQSPRERLAQRLNMTYEGLIKLVFMSKSAQRASIGEISAQEHWTYVTHKLGLPSTEQKAIIAEFFAGDFIDYFLLDYIRTLRPSYKIGLLSNAWSDLRQYIVEQKNDDLFDAMIISAEVGVMKPEARIYQIALEQLKVEPKEAIFMDDTSENIEAARAIGMYGIHFETPEKALAELKETLSNHR